MSCEKKRGWLTFNPAFGRSHEKQHCRSPVHSSSLITARLKPWVLFFKRFPICETFIRASISKERIKCKWVEKKQTCLLHMFTTCKSQCVLSELYSIKDFKQHSALMSKTKAKKFTIQVFNVEFPVRTLRIFLLSSCTWSRYTQAHSDIVTKLFCFWLRRQPRPCGIVAEVNNTYPLVALLLTALRIWYTLYFTVYVINQSSLHFLI